MFKIIFSLIVAFSFPLLLFGKSPNHPHKDHAITRSCEKNVFLKVADINSVIPPLWNHSINGPNDCTEDEPWKNDLWYTSDGYDIFHLVRDTHYNNPPIDMLEYFWFRGGCCGVITCIDDNNRDAIQSNRIKLVDVNTCFDTSVWMNFCTQCEDCNNSQTAPKGRWWKYEEEFLSDELDPYQTVQTALDIELEYQMLADCEWEVVYGCDDGELN